MMVITTFHDGVHALAPCPSPYTQLTCSIVMRMQVHGKKQAYPAPPDGVSPNAGSEHMAMQLVPPGNVPFQQPQAYWGPVQHSGFPFSTSSDPSQPQPYSPAILAHGPYQSR